MIRHIRRAQDLRWLPAIAVLSLAGATKAQDAGTVVLPQLAVEGARASTRGPVEGHVAPTSWRLQLNATNLSDEYYLQAFSGGANCAYGTGRSIYATLAYRW